MPDLVAASLNLTGKVARRVGGLHKPFVRQARRASRLRDQAMDVAAELRTLRDIGRAAAGAEPVVVGPWLSEVGFEILYWIPFLRWFKDRYRIHDDRMIVVTRGGAAAWYSDLTTNSVEIFDLMDAAAFGARNESRRRDEAGGGQKQLAAGTLDAEVMDHVRQRLGLQSARVCHPSLMYQLFRQFWFGNRALDVVTSHTRFTAVKPPAIADPPPLPRDFTAVKFYTGAAIPDAAPNRVMLRHIVLQLAAERPVVLLDTGMAFDEHEDYRFAGVRNVVSLSGALTPRDNLAVQTYAISRAASFVGTCGSLAWLAPLLGVPTVAVYAEDRFLLSHLYAARHAYRQAGAADFLTVDLRGAADLGAFESRLAPVGE